MVEGPVDELTDFFVSSASGSDSNDGSVIIVSVLFALGLPLVLV